MHHLPSCISICFSAARSLGFQNSVGLRIDGIYVSSNPIILHLHWGYHVRFIAYSNHIDKALEKLTVLRIYYSFLVAITTLLFGNFCKFLQIFMRLKTNIESSTNPQCLAGTLLWLLQTWSLLLVKQTEFLNAWPFFKQQFLCFELVVFLYLTIVSISIRFDYSFCQFWYISYYPNFLFSYESTVYREPWYFIRIFV